jgi:hypothetical protein
MTERRRDREDTTAQEKAVEEAKARLLEALSDASTECTLVAKRLGRKRVTENDVISYVAGAKAEWLAVERAEEALLIAMHDLAGARGEDL